MPGLFSRRTFIAGLSAAPLALAAAKTAPNIVYVLADDLGWGDLDCYNPDSAIPTPYANRFATQGVRFTDMHSPSSVCTPTRYGILTGRYCWRSRLKQGVLQGYDPSLIEPGRLTVPGMLQKRGYYTAGVGKWHLGLGDREHTDYTQPLHPGPIDRGFDYYYGIPSSLDFEPYLYFENDRCVEQPTATTKGATQPPRGVFWRAGAIAPHFEFPQVLPTLTEKAISIIKDRARVPNKPFFLYFAMPAPHTPWVPIAPFLGRSKAGLYGDFVAQVDDSFGRVVKAVDDAGLASNTLVIFTSDNGAHWTPEDKKTWPHRANANWRGMKADIWDAGHRIPFLARWPGHTKPGMVSPQLGCLTDLMATAADIVDFKLPHDAGEDSFDLLPAITGTARRPIREAIVHHSNRGMFSIRAGTWKLELGLGSGGFSMPVTEAPTPGGPEGQLYDIAKDPEEATNLYQQHPDVVARLSALLAKYQREGRSRP
jgi:arylsulfatase A-like enzyme